MVTSLILVDHSYSYPRHAYHEIRCRKVNIHLTYCSPSRLPMIILYPDPTFSATALAGDLLRRDPWMYGWRIWLWTVVCARNIYTWWNPSPYITLSRERDHIISGLSLVISCIVFPLVRDKYSSNIMRYGRLAFNVPVSDRSLKMSLNSFIAKVSWMWPLHSLHPASDCCLVTQCVPLFIKVGYERSFWSIVELQN